MNSSLIRKAGIVPAFVFWLTVGVQAEDKPRPVQYQIHAKFIDGNLPNFSLIQGGRMSFQDKNKILKAQEGVVFKVGENDSVTAQEIMQLNEIPALKNANILNESKVTTIAGQEAIIRICEEDEYLVRQPDKSFLHKTLSDDESSGVTISAIITPMANSNKNEGDHELQVDLKFRIAKLRESIPGVKLDIGRPIIKELKDQATITFRMNESIVFLAGGNANSDKDNAVLLVMQVSRLNQP